MVKRKNYCLALASKIGYKWYSQESVKMPYNVVFRLELQTDLQQLIPPSTLLLPIMYKVACSRKNVVVSCNLPYTTGFH